MAYIEVEVDIEDYLDDLTDKDLISELENRGYSIIKSDEEVLEKTIDDFNNSEDFKRYLCDLFNIGYHIDNKDLISKLSGALNCFK